MNRDVVVIGASAGGVEAALNVLAGLPADFPASVLVAIHVPANSRSVLPQIISRSTKLPAAHAVHGETLEPSRVYVAPPDHHLLVHGGRARLTRGARENGHRPAIDVLFRSAARWRGRRAIAVLLSGVLDDGTAGMIAIKSHLGTCLVQDPEDASFSAMPQSAIEHVAVDHVLPAREIGATLVDLVKETVPDTASALAKETGEVLPEDENPGVMPEIDEAKTESQGPASSFTCPDCHGALWELRDAELIRYRCRVGHAFSPDSLLAAQLDSVEEAMWIAYRTLEETASMSHNLAERARAKGLAQSAARYAEKHTAALERAHVILRALELHDRQPK